MTFSLFLLLAALAFGAGFLAGGAAFGHLLRQREQRIRRNVKAVEAVRLYLLRQGIELPAWVVRIVEDERLAAVDRPRRQGIRRPVRWWHIRRWLK